nr:hypothetical protein [Tanacetum cinerariifolium]
DFSFGDQFFSYKPSEADKNAETEVESMVNVPIQQALSSISLQTSPIIDLSSRHESPKAHQQFKATTTDTTITTTLPPPQAPQQSTTEAMMVKCIGELKHIKADLIQVNKDMEERLDSHGSRPYILEQLDIPQQVSIARMWESESYKSHEVHMQLFEALEKSMNRDHSEELAQDLAEAHDEDIRSAHIPTVNLRQGWWKPFEEERPATLKPAWSIRSSDMPVLTNNWASALASNYSPPPEDSLLAPTGDMATFIDWFCKRRGITELKPQDLEGPTDGTLQQIDEALDYRVKEFKINRMNPGLNTRFWTRKDVDQCNAFMFAIQRRLRTRRIFRNLESFVGGRIDEALDYRVKEFKKRLKTRRIFRNRESFVGGGVRDGDYRLLKHDEDIGSAHIPTVNLRQGWWKPFEEERPATLKPAWSIRSSDMPVLTNNWALALASNYSPPPEDSLLAQTGDMATFIDWFCKRRGITELKPQDLEGPTKPLPLGGPPGQVTIQSDFLFNKDLDYLRYGSKGSRPALSISKMNVAYYHDAGLEQMVPDQFWMNEECIYDIAAMYGISHWWFQIQRFYIDRHTSEGDRSAVRTHMWILSVVRIEVFSMYGYEYMKKIVLRHADLNEHVIAKRNFKQLVIRQRVKDFQLGIESYQTQDKYGVQMMMRFNEIHKFSDGTLQQIDEALDYRVKEFKINRMNPGLNTRFWTRKDVDQCNAFMFVIQRRLRTRRIFRNLESFIGGRVREGDYRLLKCTE